MKALEVLVNGEVIGLDVPPEGECFSVMMANVPRTSMRAQDLAGSESENWQWQLPDIKEGEMIAFQNGKRPKRKRKRDILNAFSRGPQNNRDRFIFRF